MKKIPLLCIALLAACTPVTDVPPDNEVSQVSIESSSSSSLQSSLQKVVQGRTGTIEPAGITIYQQGTHKLTLEDGEFLLLESSIVDLNGYVNEYVTVQGEISSTVEANGLIMSVRFISLEETSSTSSSEVTDLSESSMESESSLSSDTESSVSEDASSSTSESVSLSESTSDNPAVVALASYDYSAEFWTQEYCSNLEPYCLKMHKNWWFRSFGATSKELNRIEISNSEVENIGDGAIIVRLLSGSPADMGGSFSSVNISGNTAMAFHDWDDDRYFVVAGDASLQDAIKFVANSISRSE